MTEYQRPAKGNLLPRINQDEGYLLPSFASLLPFPYYLHRMTLLKAYAKINLGLRILDKREDGYHNIETVFHRVNIFDEITFSPSDDIQLTCDQKDIPQMRGIFVLALLYYYEQCTTLDRAFTSN